MTEIHHKNLANNSMVIKEAFLGIDFIPVTFAHQKEIEGFLQRYPQLLSGYTFGNLIGWVHEYFFSWQKWGSELLLISALIEEDHHRHLLQPIGNFTKEYQQQLLQSIRQLDYPCKIYGASSQFIKEHPEFCSHFVNFNDLNNADYVYKATDLAFLPGRHYEKKRNLIAQADELYKWKVHSLTELCKPKCSDILLELGSDAHELKTSELENELHALEIFMSHFIQLNLKGCLISIENQPAAFSIYSHMNPTTAVIFFEKAKREYKGLYQLINRETAKAILQDGYEFINREQDMGLAGLRQAKSSYYPVKMIPSHILTFRNS